MTQISAVVFLKSNYLLKYTVTISATCGVSKGGFERFGWRSLDVSVNCRGCARLIDIARNSCTVVVGLLQGSVLLEVPEQGLGCLVQNHVLLISSTESVGVQKHFHLQ